jgi:hypothetical protein
MIDQSFIAQLLYLPFAPVTEPKVILLTGGAVFSNCAGYLNELAVRY